MPGLRGPTDASVLLSVGSLKPSLSAPRCPACARVSASLPRGVSAVPVPVRSRAGLRSRRVRLFPARCRVGRASPVRRRALSAGSAARASRSLLLVSRAVGRCAAPRPRSPAVPRASPCPSRAFPPLSRPVPPPVSPPLPRLPLPPLPPAPPRPPRPSPPPPPPLFLPGISAGTPIDLKYSWWTYSLFTFG